MLHCDVVFGCLEMASKANINDYIFSLKRAVRCMTDPTEHVQQHIKLNMLTVIY